MDNITMLRLMCIIGFIFVVIALAVVSYRKTDDKINEVINDIISRRDNN